jgi:hypothetical protein
MSDQTASPKSKAELLERMREGRAAWDALIAQAPESATTEPLLSDGWSVKDLVAHVAAYENWTAAQLRAANEGRLPTNLELYNVEELPPDSADWDLDRQNAAIYARYQATPRAEVQTFAQCAYADLISALEAVPEDDLGRTDAQEWLGGTALFHLIPGQSYAHYNQHVDDLRAIVGRDTG